MSENERITREFMRGYQDGTTIAKNVAESLLAQANSEKAALMRRIDELCEQNEKLRTKNEKLQKLLASYWKAVHSPATPNVPRNWLAEMRELGVEVPE